MKTWKKILAVLVLLLLVGAFLGWRAIQRGFSARETPTAMEVFVATKARALAVPASYHSLKNPPPDTLENVRAGMEHFADHCFLCHANDGSGDTSFGKNMYPKLVLFRPCLRKGQLATKLERVCSGIAMCFGGLKYSADLMHFGFLGPKPIQLRPSSWCLAQCR